MCCITTKNAIFKLLENPKLPSDRGQKTNGYARNVELRWQSTKVKQGVMDIQEVKGSGVPGGQKRDNV